MDVLLSVQRVCARFEQHEIKRPAFLEQCARLVHQAIGCSRVGVWVFLDDESLRTLHCLVLYDGVRDQTTRVPDETGPQVSTYFQALEETGYVIATDAQAHYATSGFFAEHLRTNDVKSLLAAAFSANGKIYGAFTCTQVGSQMEWSRSQLSVLRSVGARVSLALANASRDPGVTQPSLLPDL